MTPHIVYVHGANATPKSFSFLENTLSSHTKTYITYDANDDINDIILKATSTVNEPCHIVGHSLGGVIAVRLSQLLGPTLIHSVTAISAPFGGSEAADRVSIFFPFNQFFRNLRTTNPLFRSILFTGLVVPTLSIITTGGSSPLEPKHNDGVVTVESQEKLSSTNQLYLPYTHYEVLLDHGVGSAIDTFINTNMRG